MTSIRNQVRFNNEVALLVTTAHHYDCSAFEAAGRLDQRPTNRAIVKAHDRLLEADGVLVPADPFAGLPR